MSGGPRKALIVLYAGVGALALGIGAAAGHVTAGVAMLAFVAAQIAGLLDAVRDHPRGADLLTAAYVLAAILWVGAAVTDEGAFAAMAAYCLIRAWVSRAGLLDPPPR